MADIQQQLAELLPELSAATISRTLAAATVLTIAVVLYWMIARSLSTLHTKRRLSEQTFVLLRRLTRWSLFPIMILLAAQQFGLLENLWAAMTAMLAMVAIGFVAVWSVLSNTLCSVILMVARPFNVGDDIEIPADELGGKVINFNLIFTTLRDPDGYLVQVPNNTFFQKPIKRRVGEMTVNLGDQADRNSHAA